jgi:hypothetical protein
MVHLGVRGVADVGLCDRCVDRMHEARVEEETPQASATEGEKK